MKSKEIGDRRKTIIKVELKIMHVRRTQIRLDFNLDYHFLKSFFCLFSK